MPTDYPLVRAAGTFIHSTVPDGATIGTVLAGLSVIVQRCRRGRG